MHSSRLLQRRAFTLVEILIVVLLIGILLAIALPNFVSAREISRARSCVGNLREIDAAKQQAVLDNQITGTSSATFSIDGVTATTAGPGGVYQLVANGTASGYLRRMPSCSSGGTYTVGTIDLTPKCSITGGTGSGYEAGAKWYHGLY